nr:immunoglobulin light chain junction region [Mus musculus]NSM00052.1 immunoglobulin light chain junction region [Mus musculus]NSM00739.1 immunoglobulin light chain junction region [Mus musculus]NSM01452.1 immunoglobulin light chain junction region [Mus musculus]
CLQHGESPFTF